MRLGQRRRVPVHADEIRTALDAGACGDQNASDAPARGDRSPQGTSLMQTRPAPDPLRRSSHWRSVKDPITSNRANINASLNVLVAARDAGVKRLVYAGSSSVRQHADAAQARGHAGEPAVALCAAETRGGAVRADVHAPLRLRDGHHPLLQRVRAAAGSRVAVLRRHLAVLDGAARRAPADDLRRRRADARLHLRRQRRGRRAARARRRRRRAR